MGWLLAVVAVVALAALGARFLTGQNAFRLQLTVTGTGEGRERQGDRRQGNRFRLLIPALEPFQAANCASLGFKPKLKLRLKGGTKRGGNPRLRAVLYARKGDANIGGASVALPRSVFIEQSHIGTICTRVQLAASTCPKCSVYGLARAKSPLLDDQLKGPVYLISSDNELADLHAGQHEVARGDQRQQSSDQDRLLECPRRSGEQITLNMKGGKKVLLVNSRNLCAFTPRAHRHDRWPQWQAH